MADRREILVDLLGRETVSPAFGKAADAVEKLGDSMDDLAGDAKKLDREIADAETSLRGLAAQYAKTDDAAQRVDLSKAMRRQQTEIRRMLSARKLLPDDRDTEVEAVRFAGRLAGKIASGLETAGKPIANALGGVFGSLPPQAQAAIGAGIVGAVVAVAPLIGGALSGAILGAGTAGGIVGGVAIAARHPEVKAAATATGELFSAALGRSASAFVPATIAGLRVVRAGIGDLEDDLTRAFNVSAQYVSPLAGEFMAGAESAVGGFADAVERSGPIVRTLGMIARESGELVGDTFRTLSEHSSEAGRALATLWGIFDFGVRTLVWTVNGLTWAYGAMEKFGWLLMGNLPKVAQLAAEEEAARQSGDGMSQGLQHLIAGLEGTGGAAGAAVIEVRSLAEEATRLADMAVSSEQSMSALESAIDNASEAAKRNGSGIDRNIPKQRANRDALVAIAGAANKAAADILAETGNQEKAAEASARGRAAFLKVAASMHIGAAEAKALADKLFGIPAERTTTVKARVDKATGQIVGFEKKINTIDGRVITVYTRITSKGEYIPGQGTQLKARGGPIVGPGPKGVDSVPLLAAPGEHMLTAAEVDAAGGHGAIERLRAVLRGERADLGPLGGGAAGGSAHSAAAAIHTHYWTVNVPAAANPAEVGRQVVEAIRAYERNSGEGWRR